MSDVSEKNPFPGDPVMARVDDFLHKLIDAATVFLQRTKQRLSEGQRRHVAETIVNYQRQLTRELHPSPELVQQAVESLVGGDTSLDRPN
jgi:hypothetical protein